MVADGEFYVGLTIEKSAIKYADDPSVGFVYPKDGTSAVPDGVALVKGCPNEENAKLFIDFVTSKECQTEQSQNWGTPSGKKRYGSWRRHGQVRGSGY